MNPALTLTIIGLYFVLLFIISYLTGRKADDSTFFNANRNSPWYLVAFGMIGASLSGVTFISIPGAVGAGGLNQAFSYMQMVFGYLVGYAVIALILMPVYYRLNLTTIYTYLEQRFGFWSYKTGAAFFLLSRVIGASFRLYLVAIVLDQFVMKPMGIPFWATVLATIILIWIYTYRGGIKTVVWTDTFQTLSMLVAVILTVWAIAKGMGLGLGEMVSTIRDSAYGQMFFFEGGWGDANNFFKQFLGGAAIATVMTGMDQDMMQKNLTCRNLKEAQKNVLGFSVVLIFVNLLFLALGALLYLFAQHQGISLPAKSDQVFPTIALTHLSPLIGIVFILGLIAAAYSSADSALTSLTTSFCIDFLGFEKKPAGPQQTRTRLWVHVGFSVLILIVILLFKALNNDAVINSLFRVATYTYGPILGLFSYGLIMKQKVRDPLVPLICILAPIVGYILNVYSETLFNGYKFGFELLILNGLLTFLGLWMLSVKSNSHEVRKAG